MSGGARRDRRKRRDEVTDGGGGKRVCPSAAGGRRGHLRAAQNPGVTSSFHFALATCSALLNGGRRQNRRAKDNRSARTAGKIGPQRDAQRFVHCRVPICAPAM